MALGLLENGLSFKGEGAKRSGFGEMERSKRLMGRGGILGREEVFVFSSFSVLLEGRGGMIGCCTEAADMMSMCKKVDWVAEYETERLLAF